MLTQYKVEIYRKNAAKRAREPTVAYLPIVHRKKAADYPCKLRDCKVAKGEWHGFWKEHRPNGRRLNHGVQCGLTTDK